MPLIGENTYIWFGLVSLISLIATIKVFIDAFKKNQKVIWGDKKEDIFSREFVLYFVKFSICSMLFCFSFLVFCICLTNHIFSQNRN